MIRFLADRTFQLRYDEDVREDSGARQRIKVVPVGAACGSALPPPEVSKK